MKKFLLYFAGLALSAVFVIITTYFFNRSNNSVLFFNAINIAIIIGIISGMFINLLISEKAVFTKFVIVLSVVLFNLNIMYMGPISLDRSLSAFLYFYAAEKGSITTNIYNENYFNKFINRRYVDGEKMGFLLCNQSVCYPTKKAKMFYYILHPLSIMTNVSDNYNEFKSFVSNL